VGKTTLAKELAAHLALPYLDTGAMYRAVALALGEGGWQRPEAELGQVLSAMRFGLEGQGPDTTLTLDGKPIGPEIRTEQVAAWASQVARLPVVRTALVRAQQGMGAATGLVAEGRDMGTVVFPQAWRKFFLDADPRVRAQRRCLQLKDMGSEADEEEIFVQIKLRDERDRTRAESPLVPADDAIKVDTSQTDLDGVLTELLSHLD
jgi:cytidylate kinase